MLTKKIWIDLDNSPHVPFFMPIVDKLKKYGYEVILTGRDCFQVKELVGLHAVRCILKGRHYGRNKFLKVIGLLIRALQLAPTVWSAKPNLAISHGSRAQLLIASVFGIPSVLILDYEHVTMLPFIQPTWAIAPEVIPDKIVRKYGKIIIKYPGFKENVYISSFAPDSSILANLGIDDEHLVATIRPPATEAHYHNVRSEDLFEALINFLGPTQNTHIVLLPRHEKQAAWVRMKWPQWCLNGKIIIPDHVVNGLNLIWHSDLVISGGGTITREAAALRVPAYSIFCGKLGAVDQFLMKTGRLIMLKTVADVHAKIILKRRPRPLWPKNSGDATLCHIVEKIKAMLDNNAMNIAF